MMVQKQINHAIKIKIFPFRYLFMATLYYFKQYRLMHKHCITHISTFRFIMYI